MSAAKAFPSARVCFGVPTAVLPHEQREVGTAGLNEE